MAKVFRNGVRTVVSLMVVVLNGNDGNVNVNEDEELNSVDGMGRILLGGRRLGLTTKS